jgi:hypothetical protein
MWENVEPDIGERRERQLKEQFWGPLIEKGAAVEPLRRSTRGEAWRIVDDLVKKHSYGGVVLLQKELVDLRRGLYLTEAAKVLYAPLQDLLVQVGKSGDPKLKKEYKKIEHQIRKLFNKLNTLKRAPSSRIQKFFRQSQRKESEEVLGGRWRLKVPVRQKKAQLGKSLKDLSVQGERTGGGEKERERDGGRQPIN